jgi:hypothetical protein
MKRSDAICPQCHAGFRRIEVDSGLGVEGEYRCPLCDHLLEKFRGAQQIVYRLTITPARRASG